MTWNREEITRILGKLDLCECGSGSASTWAIVLLLLDRAERNHACGAEEAKAACFYDEADGASALWVEFGAKVLDSWCLLEHGTGIGHAWLTRDGEMLLAFLRDFGTESDAWPEWWSQA